ncbi:hypothetical protein Tco_1239615 [Tanacetum coccineum]
MGENKDKQDDGLRSNVDDEVLNGMQDDETSREVNSGVGMNSCIFPNVNTHNIINTHSENHDKDNIEEIRNNNDKQTSYANLLTKSLIVDGNKLFTIPTSTNSKGEEVVLSDEELVMEGCDKWKLTVCGYFVGCKMHVNVLKYNSRRIWTRFRLKDIVVDADEMCCFRFKDEEGMKYIIDQSPWISIKGISAISSRLGKPLIMDQMTSDMCKVGSGRLGYARVLVEVDAGKGYLDKIEINYADAMKKVKMTKWVKVEYSWKPDRCEHCKVFGHTFKYCKSNQMNVRNESNKKAKINANSKDNEGFMEVRNRKNKHGTKLGMNNGTQGNKQGYKRNVMNIQQRYVVKQKLPESNSKEGDKGNSINVHDKGKSGETSNDSKRGSDLKTRKNKENAENKSTSSLEKIWNIGHKKIKEMRTSANKYVVLSEDMNTLEFDGDVFQDDRIIVDRYILRKMQPPPEEFQKWTYDMQQYFKYRWNYINGMEDSSDEEDIIEENNVANDLVADEIGGGDS